jgi:hypothetical protein
VRQYKENVAKREEHELTLKLLAKQQQNLEREREQLNEQTRIREEQEQQAAREQQRRDYYQGLTSKMTAESKSTSQSPRQTRTAVWTRRT